MLTFHFLIMLVRRHVKKCTSKKEGLSIFGITLNKAYEIRINKALWLEYRAIELHLIMQRKKRDLCRHRWSDCDRRERAWMNLYTCVSEGRGEGGRGGVKRSALEKSWGASSAQASYLKKRLAPLDVARRWSSEARRRRWDAEGRQDALRCHARQAVRDPTWAPLKRRSRRRRMCNWRGGRSLSAKSHDQRSLLSARQNARTLQILTHYRSAMPFGNRKNYFRGFFQFGIVRI